MIAVDTNVLVYAHRTDSEFHEGASSALRALAESAEYWAIPWPCIHEFLAVVTNPRIFREPTQVGTAVAQIGYWLEAPFLTLIGETATHWRILSEILQEGKIAGAKVHDARIAAICQTNGVRELWSADRDFSRITGLRTRNPLVHRKGER